MFKITAVLFFMILIFVIYSSYLKKDNGVEDNKIILGQSCAMTGSATDLGRSIHNGALAYFKYINSIGGVHGRKIELITYDDKYEPSLAKENSLRLIKKDKVFALFGEMGSPTSKVVLDVVNKYKVPFLTPYSGAEFLRKPFNPLVVNFRASYYAETEALVKYLVDDLKMNNIAVFYQNDSYGKAGLRGTEIALKKRRLRLSAKGAYVRNTLSITTALNFIKRVKPQAVIMVGVNKPSIKFIKRAKKEGLVNTIFAAISAIGSEILAKELKGNTDNIVISQVVPLACNISNAAVAEYKEILEKYSPDKSCNFISLEGFLSAKLVVEALKLNGESLTRKSFIRSFEQLPNNALHGIEIGLSPNDHQAMDSIYLTTFKNGELVAIEEKK
ncbi:putative leucine/isoleucine/valine-binding protein precursor [Sulfurimonas gotlandica GD1]|uniref:Putative leucine/isoleucine/valine-binding protein n=2 Tax=Sulfurimonas TaxID=202746 RepID=H1FVI5_SULGG|nr:putative leucine/isoleucine/valine-binding protein precursor [Sulfurimonas gotlandica GD1]